MQPCPKITRDQQELTQEQRDYIREFAYERSAAMLSIALSDEQEAEEHLRAFYRDAEKEPSVTIRWFDSPLALVRACVPYFLENSMPDCMRGSGVDANAWVKANTTLGRGVCANVRHLVDVCLTYSGAPSVLLVGTRDGVWSWVEASVKDSVADNVAASVVESVRDGLDANLRTRVLDNVWTTLVNSVAESVRVAHSAPVWDVERSMKASMEASVAKIVWASVEASIAE